MKDRPRAALIVLGLTVGLWGLRWGLPSRERLALVLPPGADGAELHERLASSWAKMHERLGANLMNNPESFATFTGVQRAAPGWTSPPDILLNSVRSFFTRSAYEDEQSALLALSRMRPKELNFNPHLFTYGGAYLYPLAAWEAAGAVLGAVTLKPGLAVYLDDPAKMAGLYYWGRVMSAFFFVGCGLMLLRLGRALGAGTGPLAAALFFLCPAAIIHAHSLKNHIVWTFLALLTLDRCLVLLKRGKDADYAATGAAAGAVVGAFLMGWPATLFVALAAALRLRLGRGTPSAALRGLAIAAVCAVVAFFATNPYWILSLREALAELRALSGHSHFDWRSPAVFFFGSMRDSVTIPVLALIAAGAAYAFRRGKRDPELFLVLSCFLVALSFAWVTPDVSAAFSVRYGLGWVAIGLLLAARAVTAAWEAVKPRERAPLSIGLAVFGAYAVLVAATYARNFALDAGPGSTHALSGAWIEANIPAGESIGMLRLPQPSNAPYFQYARYDLRFIEPALFGGLAEGQLPRYLAVTTPIHDDRPGMEPNLSRYERVARFDRFQFVPGVAVDPASSTANPLIEIYRMKPLQ